MRYPFDATRGLTENQLALLQFVRDHPHCTRGELNDALAGVGGIYARDGWKWGIRGLIDRGLVKQDWAGHYVAVSE